MEETETKSTAVNSEHLTSAAAFVQGGIQDACDDACSICLEPFSDSDPSTVRIIDRLLSVVMFWIRSYCSIFFCR